MRQRHNLELAEGSRGHGQAVQQEGVSYAGLVDVWLDRQVSIATESALVEVSLAAILIL